MLPIGIWVWNKEVPVLFFSARLFVFQNLNFFSICHSFIYEVVSELTEITLEGKIDLVKLNKRPPHTFSTVDLPSSPAGLTIRIKIKIAKAMPSR